MSFQTRKSFVHLQIINSYIFDEIQESEPPIDSKGPDQGPET